jgi:hypothetical protein
MRSQPELSDSLRAELIEVVVQVEDLVNGPVFDQVVDGDEHAVGHRDRCSPLAASRRQAVAMGRAFSSPLVPREAELNRLD